PTSSLSLLPSLDPPAPTPPPFPYTTLFRSVKAGILPKVAGHVAAIYVEAVPGETETRLSRALKRRFPEVPEDLPRALASIRQGLDRKSTRLNSSHQIISYAVFCLKKKKNHC